MRNKLIVMSALLALSTGFVAAQAPTRPAGEAGRQTAPAPTAKPSPIAKPGEVAIVGCVELEGDYRKRMAAGRGGTLGSGVGAANEVVLTDARPAPADHSSHAHAGAQNAKSMTGGAGGGVYTLTGNAEAALIRQVGKQVEVVGKMENQGKRETGADVRDISDLPRIDISTWHPVADFCPAK